MWYLIGLVAFCGFISLVCYGLVFVIREMADDWADGYRQEGYEAALDDVEKRLEKEPFTHGNLKAIRRKPQTK